MANGDAAGRARRAANRVVRNELVFRGWETRRVELCVFVHGCTAPTQQNARVTRRT